MKPQRSLFMPLLVVSGALAPAIALSHNRPSLAWLLVGAQVALISVCLYIAIKNPQPPVDKL